MLGNDNSFLTEMASIRLLLSYREQYDVKNWAIEPKIHLSIPEKDWLRDANCVASLVVDYGCVWKLDAVRH